MSFAGHSATRAARRVTARAPELINTGPRKRMTILGVIGLLLTLLVVGCADGGASSDNDKHPVFYGGVNGGGTRP
jgi:hypothetical protein